MLESFVECGQAPKIGQAEGQNLQRVGLGEEADPRLRSFAGLLMIATRRLGELPLSDRPHLRIKDAQNQAAILAILPIMANLRHRRRTPRI
jgi:hypothetical protein